MELKADQGYSNYDFILLQKEVDPQIYKPREPRRSHHDCSLLEDHMLYTLLKSTNPTQTLLPKDFLTCNGIRNIETLKILTRTFNTLHDKILALFKEGKNSLSISQQLPRHMFNTIHLMIAP